MYAYAYAHMHICTYARMHVCTYARMHVCMYACMHVCIYYVKLQYNVLYHIISTQVCSTDQIPHRVHNHRTINIHTHTCYGFARGTCSSAHVLVSACLAPFGWHYLYNATSLIRPHLCYVFFVVSRIIILRHIIHHV